MYSNTQYIITQTYLWVLQEPRPHPCGGWNDYIGPPQFSSVAQSCPTLRPHGLRRARPPCPSPTPRVYSDSRPLSRWSSYHLILCHPSLLPTSVFPSIRVFSLFIYLFIFRVFSNESVLCVKWPKYWSFNFNIGPSNEYSGLVSFGDGLLGSPCSPRDSQESSPTHSSKASILWYSTLWFNSHIHTWLLEKPSL